MCVNFRILALGVKKMTAYPFNFDLIDPSWHDLVLKGLAKMDVNYLLSISQSKNWLPGPEKIFSAFSLPLSQVNYVLFGESPYPRTESANGYAFWDAAVQELWSPTGLSRKVNRATSLRNIIKMLLIAEGYLKQNHTSQDDIAKINKQALVRTNEEFFNNFFKHGILLLNASLVLQTGSPLKDARAWYPFIRELLNGLIQK